MIACLSLVTRRFQVTEVFGGEHCSISFPEIDAINSYIRLHFGRKLQALLEVGYWGELWKLRTICYIVGVRRLKGLKESRQCWVFGAQTVSFINLDWPSLVLHLWVCQGGTLFLWGPCSIFNIPLGPIKCWGQEDGSAMQSSCLTNDNPRFDPYHCVVPW